MSDLNLYKPKERHDSHRVFLLALAASRFAGSYFPYAVLLSRLGAVLVQKRELLFSNTENPPVTNADKWIGFNAL